MKLHMLSGLDNSGIYVVSFPTHSYLFIFNSLTLQGLLEELYFSNSRLRGLIPNKHQIDPKIYAWPSKPVFEYNATFYLEMS